TWPTRSVSCVPWLSVTGLSNSTMTASAVQFGLTVGVTLRICSGIWMATRVVGDPSQPCGMEKVSTAYEPALPSLGLTVTWAPASAAEAQTSAAAPQVAPARRAMVGRGDFMRGLLA